MIADSGVMLRGNVFMPLLGLGTWQMRGREAYDAVLHALRVGYRHIDTATAYRNEADIGRAIRDSGVPREDIFLTTKLPPDRTGRELSTIERSLADLGTEFVDLWLVHWPPRGMASPSTWREVVAVQKVGLARAVGVSNYSIEQIAELIADSGVTPAVNQIRWSPFLYDAVRVVELRERGVVLEGYSPFRAARLGHPVLVEIARRHGHPQVVASGPDRSQCRCFWLCPVAGRGSGNRFASTLTGLAHHDLRTASQCAAETSLPFG